MSYVIFNDLIYWKDYLFLFLAIDIIYVTSILWHELGHMLYFKFKLNRDIKIRYVKGEGFKAGIESDYNHITETDYARINVMGILLGILPIVVAVKFNTSPFPYLIILPLYLLGCKGDIKRFMEITNKQD